MNRSMRALRHAGVIPSLLMLLVVLALNARLQPHFFGLPSLEANIATFTPTIMICLAQAVIVLSRELDLSLGAGVSLINCFMAVVPAYAVGGPWALMGLALLMALGLGAINGLIITVLKLPSLIATFATGAVWYGLALTFMPQPGGEIDETIGNVYGDTVLGVPVPLLIVFAALLLWTVLSRHRLGRRIVAVGSNPVAAYQAGIPVPAVKFTAYLVAWLLVGLGALSISAQTLSGDAGVGTAYTLTSVAAVVIGGISLGGGRGTPWGALIGALVLGIVTNVIYFAGIPSIWQEFFKGLVVVAALGFMVLEQRRTAIV
ncbi:MAG TPA: ABC transporter permease [Acidisoma sp.]|uniref:ABC transporter permease n=1 Tax=Acidisoma sp. TaxID=1872115 RepID=UPI002C051EAC|nr:ABC transporter permease [Acidisoma sp.]HTH99591.1 ABC transporter permease [Acidisoma sp.]